MNTLRTLTLATAAMAFAGMAAGAAHAATFVTHEYTGAPYTFYLDTGDTAPPNPWLAAPQDFVSGRFTIDTSLLPGGTDENLPFGDYSAAVVDFDFFDGVIRWDDPAELVIQEFSFATDAQGALTDWLFALFQDLPDLLIGPDGDVVVSGSANGENFYEVFVRSDMPGQFSVVPVPAALPLMASALVGFGVLVRRRRRT